MQKTIDITALVDSLPFPALWLEKRYEPRHVNDAFDVLLTLDATLTDQLVHRLIEGQGDHDFSLVEQSFEFWQFSLGPKGWLVGLMPRAESALSERESAKDQKRLLLALQNIVSTTKGYAELIAVMLEENLIVAGERLEAIRRYEQYVSDHLQDMEALVESALDRRPMAQLLEQEHPQLVLVCFDLAIQGEVVAELFRAQGMVVTQATSKEAATQILREQGSAFDLLVIGDWFDAAGHWLDASDDRRMILCNGRAFDHPRARLLSAPKLDMNHLLRAAIELSELEAG
ncbi:MAG: hypothetical protein ACO20O_09360 [Pseudomonadales bacterium]